MKKLIYTALVSIAGIIVLQSFNVYDAGKMRDGSEPGHTGSPADGKNCTVCHGGSSEPVNGWISSTIPESGYIPGERYTIRAVNRTIGHTRFGFQVSPQNISGTILGTLIATDTIRTKVVGDNNGYVTYRPASVVGVDSMVWVFDWVAPADTVNEVVFYGAFNSNHDGHKGGDITQLSQLRVFKQGFTSLAKTKGNAISVSVYPNPAHSKIYLHAQTRLGAEYDISLYDMSGKCVWKGNNLIDKSAIDVSQFEKGIYIIEIKSNNEVATQRVMIQ
jgi:hypothetical protein